ncbi:MAG: hypothetical protein EP329_14535 [Deltaproteobacteria bacterium]|nr:MAG: hypothetical protein EP329_14535 [Deltaproteobacteria bacterium]
MSTSTSKSTIVATLTLALALGLGPAALAADTAPAPEGSLIDRLIAVVNTDPITLFELHRAAAPFVAKVLSESPADEVPGKLDQVQAEVLDNLINDLLVYAQAKDLGLSVAPEKIDEHIERIRTANGWTVEELTEQLRRLGFASLADYRRHTEREMLKSNAISIKVGSRVKVDEKDVAAEAQRRVGEGNTVEERRALHILLRVDPMGGTDASEAIRQKLLAERERIVAGDESFEEAARRVSEDDGTRPAGGDLSWFVQGDFDPDFEQAAFELPLNDVSEPIRTQFGWHLIKVIAIRDKRIEGDEDIEKLKREIRFRLRQTELERLYLQWVKGLRAQAFIEVKDPRFLRHAAGTAGHPGEG